MSRISSKSLNNYPWYLRLLLYLQKKKYGSMLEPVLIWGRTPKVFLAFLIMQKALNRKKSQLDPTLRALITTLVSQINQCAFCIDMNSFLFLQRGGCIEKILNLSTFKEKTLFTDLEKAALEYTEAITKNAVSNEVFCKLKSYFNEDAITELTALIAFQNLSSKFNAALDIQAFGFCKKPI